MALQWFSVGTPKLTGGANVTWSFPLVGAGLSLHDVHLCARDAVDGDAVNHQNQFEKFVADMFVTYDSCYHIKKIPVNVLKRFETAIPTPVTTLVGAEPVPASFLRPEKSFAFSTSLPLTILCPFGLIVEKDGALQLTCSRDKVPEWVLRNTLYLVDNAPSYVRSLLDQPSIVTSVKCFDLKVIKYDPESPFSPLAYTRTGENFVEFNGICGIIAIYAGDTYDPLPCNPMHPAHDLWPSTWYHLGSGVLTMSQHPGVDAASLPSVILGDHRITFHRNFEDGVPPNLYILATNTMRMTSSLCVLDSA